MEITNVHRSECSEVESLLIQAKAGSRSGLGDLLESFRPAIEARAERECTSKLRGRVSRSDIIQDTMLTASRGFTRFRGETRVEFQAWLFRIFESRLTDNLRRHLVSEKRRCNKEDKLESFSVVDRSPTPSEVASSSEESRSLIEAIGRMNDSDQQLLMLRYYQQKSFAEIASQLEIPLATVWRRWGRLLELLRTRLSEHH